MDGVKNAPPLKRRNHESRADAALFGVLKSEYERRNLTEKKIFSDWAVIVGADLAAATAPLRIKYRSANDAALHVALYRSALSMDVQMRQAEILENLARYLGHRNVSRLVICRHCSPPPKPCRIIATRPRNEELWRSYQMRADITDPELRASLESFALAFCGKE